MNNPAPIEKYLNPDRTDHDEPLDGEPDPAWKGGQGRDGEEVAESGGAMIGGSTLALAFIVGMLFARLILV